MIMIIIIVIMFSSVFKAVKSYYNIYTKSNENKRKYDMSSVGFRNSFYTL
jgi:hypothetical protein